MRDDGGTAFPVSIPGCGDNGAEGMSLRDWFAGQALPFVVDKSGGMSEWELKRLFGDISGITRPQIAAALAYELADEMLKWRVRARQG